MSGFAVSVQAQLCNTKRHADHSELEKVMEIPGVEFVVDNAGRKRAVLIDLKRHRALWEDLYDAYLARKRRKEPRESLEFVKLRIEGRAKRRRPCA